MAVITLPLENKMTTEIAVMLNAKIQNKEIDNNFFQAIQHGGYDVELTAIIDITSI